MSDHYSKLTQSGLGKTVAKNLGLPTPVQLQRYEQGQPILCGEVAVAGADGAKFESDILAVLSALEAKITTKAQLPSKLLNQHMYFKVVVYDASGIQTPEQLEQLYQFFSSLVKRIKPSGKILITACSDEQTGVNLAYSAAQKAVLGFVKSLAKEVGRGICVNALYINRHTQDHLRHAFEFLLSHKSAYVSGQAIHLDARLNANQLSSTQNQSAYPKPSLNGKKILITGAAGDIGRATCQVLLREGAVLYCVDLPQNIARLQEMANQVNTLTACRIQILPLDITQEDAAINIIQATGTLDGVVHSAGIAMDKTLANMSLNQWQNVIDVNLIAMVNLTQQLLNHSALNDLARVVCLSSIVGICGNFGQSNYAAAKAGVFGMVQALAKVFALTDKRVNAVAAGFIESGMTQRIPFTIKEAGRRMNAMNQGGLPIDVAEAVAWLLSKKADGLNGQTIRVCGQSVLGA